MLVAASGNASEGACRKAVGRTRRPNAPRSSCLVNLLKSEETREQIVLIIDGPVAGKAEALLQSERGFEACDCPPRRHEGLEAANPDELVGLGDG